MRPRIYITQPVADSAVARLRAVADVEMNPDTLHIATKAELLERLPGLDILFCLLHDRVDRAVIAAGKRLRAIASMKITPSDIDVAAATARRIPVTVIAPIVTEATGETELLPAELVFRSVGYRGVALPDVPFEPRTGLIPNLKGRVLDGATRVPLAGHYATGWIKRGPTGVIGNNKADSVETVNVLLEDAAAGTLPVPPAPVVHSKDSTKASEPAALLSTKTS